MALSYSDEPEKLTSGGRGRAILKLVIIVLAIDAVAIAGFFILTQVLGWDQTLPFMVVIVTSVITGFYFQWKKQKIEG
jgi:hypothetical protein